MDASFTRRTFLQLASASAAAHLGFGYASAQQSLPERVIPATGERLPIVGLGSTRPVASIAEQGSKRAEAVVRTLVEHGGKVVDTWPRNVENDSAFGAIISQPDLRDRLFVTINIQQTGREAAIAQFERTLQAYQREQIDLVNVGSLVDLETHWPTFQAWKQAGRTRYIGVTAAESKLYGQLEAFLARATPDFVEINYSVTERDAERLLPMLAGRGIAVLISRPFMNGAYFDRLEGRALPEWTKEFGCESWAQFSLQYILANPAITCVLTETTNPMHMAENMLAALKPMPDATARERMRAFIDRV